MGWTGLYYKPRSIPDYFKEQWGKKSPDCSYLECLGQAFVGRFVLYGVWQRIMADGSRDETFATVTRIQYGHGKNDLPFYYKDMDESMGPVEAKCPMSLLKKLKTPAINEHAAAWRKECWKYGLGISREGALAKVRRMINRYPKKALDIVNKFNDVNRNNPIIVTYNNRCR